MKRIICFFRGHVNNKDKCLRCGRLTIDKINRDLFEWGYLHADYSSHEWGELSDWRNGVKYATCKVCKEKRAMLAITNPN